MSCRSASRFGEWTGMAMVVPANAAAVTVSGRVVAARGAEDARVVRLPEPAGATTSAA
jgi:hypothetical protein